MAADAKRRRFVRILDDWETSDTPPEHFKVCHERTKGIVHGFLVRATFGRPLDIYALAESCYAQGVEDVVALELMKEKAKREEEGPWLVPNG